MKNIIISTTNLIKWVGCLVSVVRKAEQQKNECLSSVSHTDADSLSVQSLANMFHRECANWIDDVKRSKAKCISNWWTTSWPNRRCLLERLTWGSPAMKTTIGQTEAETRCCQSSSGKTGGPSGRWTPGNGRDAPPPECSDHGIPSST